MPHSGGGGHTLGSTSVSWEAEERGRGMGKGLYCGFYGREQVRQGEQALGYRGCAQLARTRP